MILISNAIRKVKRSFPSYQNRGVLKSMHFVRHEITGVKFLYSWVIFACLFIANCFALATSSLLAQSPQGIPYQAVMRNADGSVMASSAVSLTFMIHDGTANGTVVYQESHALTSNAQGLVSCVVGNGVVLQGNFENINWGNSAKYLHVMMGAIDLGVQQLLSVPYALIAADVPSRVSTVGDTLFVGSQFAIVPGISAANYPIVAGCTNPQACNYNNAATQNDNTCLYPNSSCDDGNVNTYNDVFSVNCECIGTPVNSSGLGSQLLPTVSTCANQMISVSGCGGQNSLSYDGKVYDLVEIGGQCWFADNLATDQYADGSLIVTGINSNSWFNASYGAYVIYNDLPINDQNYGKLYNWYATVDSRGLCPTGWHVPTDCEWMYLENSLGMSATVLSNTGNRGTSEGGSLKSTSFWMSPNVGATNSSGFTAVPGGLRTNYGTYAGLNNYAYIWSSTASGTNAIVRVLTDSDASIGRMIDYPQMGFSVRCLKD
jgi:uncharacterized protein (TIGR02145 family)